MWRVLEGLGLELEGCQYSGGINFVGSLTLEISLL